MHSIPTRTRPRVRTGALAAAGVCVLVGGVVGGAPAAFASTDSTFSALSSDFASAPDHITLGASITDTTGTLTLGPNSGTSGYTTLHLNGKTLTVQGIQLTSDLDGDGTTAASRLTIVGAGTLVVAQTDSSLPAIEVSGGSTLTISSGTVVAAVPANSTAAAIGGGPSAGPGPQNAGGITLNGTADVTATGGDRGAAIGGGYGGSADVAIDDSAKVVATVKGGAAAIGAGFGSGTSSVRLLHYADVTARQDGTGPTGAAVGGGASPTGQTAGTVSLGDEAHLTATSSGAGSAIGGGYHGDGGMITATGYATIVATGAQAAIGDGEHSTGGGTTVSLSGQGVQVSAHGGTGVAGGAGIGGGATAYGNDALTVDGGATLSATSDNGPGIGGVGNTVGMSVGIGRATVTATGGGAGAGIGAGSAGSFGASVSIGDGATVSVGGGLTAIGGAAGRFGTLSSSGSLTLLNGSSIVVPAGATAYSSGTFANNGTVTVNGTFTNSGAITNSGVINGSGTLDNQGVLVQNGAVSVASITGNNYHVVYDAQAGSSGTGEQYVYAPTLAAAGLSVPSANPPSVGSFTGWNTAADGTGAALGRSSSIASDLQAGGSSDGRAVLVRVFALYQLAPVLPAGGTLKQAVVGTPYSDSVGATAGTAPISYSYTGSLPAGLTFDGSSGTISGSPRTAGSFLLHVTASNGAGSASHDYGIQVVEMPITLVVPSRRFAAGASVTVEIGGLQANESYTVKIAGRTVESGTAASSAVFTKTVIVPKSVSDGLQTVVVTGAGHASPRTAEILTAAVSKSLGLKLSAKKVKHGKKVVVSVSKLYAGESVRVVIKGKHGKTAVAKANAKGTYVLTLKKGLAKGKYTVTVTGAGTSRKASAKLTVS